MAEPSLSVTSTSPAPAARSTSRHPRQPAPGIISADVTVSGNAEFDGNVGSTGPLSSLDVTGTTLVTNGVTLTTAGNQTFTGGVTLGSDGGLTTYTFKSTGGTVDFQGGVDGTVAGEELLAVTGNAEFDTSVGSNVALGSLSVSGTTVLSDAVSVTTTNSDGASGNQTYTGDVSLGSNLNDTYTFDSTGGLVDFGGQVNGTFSGEEVLVVNGNAEFDSTVGSSGVPLNSVFVGGTTKFDGTVTTTGDQTYTGAVTLNTDETLTSTAGSIAFGSTVDAASAGGEALTVNATAGTTTFGGNVGAGEALKSLSVDTGSLSIGGNITTENDLSLDVVGAGQTLTVTSATRSRRTRQHHARDGHGRRRHRARRQCHGGKHRRHTNGRPDFGRRRFADGRRHRRQCADGIGRRHGEPDRRQHDRHARRLHGLRQQCILAHERRR